MQERLGPGVIVGRSTAIQRVLEQARQVAATDSTVLLLGETGTGKELIATQIHEQSSRRGRVMVRINCAAIPSTLIESELFGREKGAFTGALARQIGRFELADHSTIFLDEIGDLPFDVQVKLLRVLEERQIERLGSPKAVGVDVRIIAATHRNLEQRIATDAFRQDLYYRLNVFPIDVPPLRERIEDIPLLVWRFVDEFSKSFGKRVDAIPRDNMDALQRYAWPGNIRELRNVVERAMIVAVGHNLTIAIPAQPPLGARTQREADGRREGARPQGRRRMPLAHPRRRRRRGAAWTSADDARDTYGQAWDQAPGAAMLNGTSSGIPDVLRDAGERRIRGRDAVARQPVSAGNERIRTSRRFERAAASGRRVSSLPNGGASGIPRDLCATVGYEEAPVVVRSLVSQKSSQYGHS